MDPGGSEEYGEVPTRPMKVKVLYSFDLEHKTNCLARIPSTLQIPAVAIDETSQVGVIDLQQCIQTITAASPELLSRLADGDFTIYAYDYSEEDTPLVGQGMLSAALAGSSGGDRVMITGRVCKNVAAIFNNGVKETLEVKLRLTPVSKAAATAPVAPKSASPATTAGFDPNAWNASVQQSRAQQQTESYFDFAAGNTMSDNDLALVDEMLGIGSGSSGTGSGGQLTGGVGMAETPTDPAYGFNPAFSHSAPGSRAGSPMMGLDSSSSNELLRHQSFSAGMPSTFADQSRPASRASVRSEVQPSRHQRQASTQSLPPQPLLAQTEAYFNEDGQPRKRAKVTQADWRGRSSFGAKSGDLRVTAAAAHSVHMHRPIAKRPAAPGSDLEPPPRAPTPVPQRHPMMQTRPSQQPQRSFLRQASTYSDSDFMSDADQFSDAIGDSPEDASPNNSITAEGTPENIPSSPPVLMRTRYQPSSPGLPTGHLPDSGFYSMDALEQADDENRSPDAADFEMAAQYSARDVRQSTNEPMIMAGDFEIEMQMPGDMNQLPQKIIPNQVAIQRGNSQGYVESHEMLFEELFGSTDDFTLYPITDAPYQTKAD